MLLKSFPCDARLKYQIEAVNGEKELKRVVFTMHYKNGRATYYVAISYNNIILVTHRINKNMMNKVDL